MRRTSMIGRLKVIAGQLRGVEREAERRGQDEILPVLFEVQRTVRELITAIALLDRPTASEDHHGAGGESRDAA